MPGAALGLSNAGVTSAFSSCPRLPPSRRPSRSPSPGSCPAISPSRVDATRRSGPEPLALDSNCDDRCRSSESVAARGREQARAILGPACDGMQAMVQFGCLARRERPSPAPSHITCQVYPPIPRLDLAAHMEHPSRRRERHRAPAFPNWSVASTGAAAHGIRPHRATQFAEPSVRSRDPYEVLPLARPSSRVVRHDRALQRPAAVPRHPEQRTVEGTIGARRSAIVRTSAPRDAGRGRRSRLWARCPASTQSELLRPIPSGIFLGLGEFPE